MCGEEGKKKHDNKQNYLREQNKKTTCRSLHARAVDRYYTRTHTLTNSIYDIVIFSPKPVQIVIMVENFLIKKNKRETKTVLRSIP